jgi:hypothetical protein
MRAGGFSRISISGPRASADDMEFDFSSQFAAGQFVDVAIDIEALVPVVRPMVRGDPQWLVAFPSRPADRMEKPGIGTRPNDAVRPGQRFFAASTSSAPKVVLATRPVWVITTTSGLEERSKRTSHPLNSNQRVSWEVHWFAPPQEPRRGFRLIATRATGFFRRISILPP